MAAALLELELSGLAFFSDVYARYFALNGAAAAADTLSGASFSFQALQAAIKANPVKAGAAIIAGLVAVVTIGPEVAASGAIATLAESLVDVVGAELAPAAADSIVTFLLGEGGTSLYNAVLALQNSVLTQLGGSSTGVSVPPNQSNSTYDFIIPSDIGPGASYLILTQGAGNTTNQLTLNFPSGVPAADPDTDSLILSTNGTTSRLALDSGTWSSVLYNGQQLSVALINGAGAAVGSLFINLHTGAATFLSETGAQLTSDGTSPIDVTMASNGSVLLNFIAGIANPIDLAISTADLSGVATNGTNSLTISAGLVTSVSAQPVGFLLGLLGGGSEAVTSAADGSIVATTYAGPSERGAITRIEIAGATSDAVQLGSQETLALDNPIGFGGTISGFIPGDTIDLANIGIATSATLDAGNVLSVTGGSSPVSLQLDPAANYSNDTFAVSYDNSGGSYVTIQAAPQPPPPPPTSPINIQTPASAITGQVNSITYTYHGAAQMFEIPEDSGNYPPNAPEGFLTAVATFNVPAGYTGIAQPTFLAITALGVTFSYTGLGVLGLPGQSATFMDGNITQWSFSAGGAGEVPGTSGGFTTEGGGGQIGGDFGEDWFSPGQLGVSTSYTPVGSLTPIEGGAGTWTLASYNTSVTVTPLPGQTQQLSDVLANSNLTAQGTLQNLVVNGPGTVKLTGAAAVPNLEITAGGSLVLQGANLTTDPIAVDANGNISGYGRLSGDETVNGTITAAGGALDLDGDITGGGTLIVGQGASLELDGAVTAADAVALSGGSASLILGWSANVGAPISGFALGDSILLAGQSAIADAYDPDTHALAITSSTELVYTLSLVGAYQESNFGIANGAVVFTTGVPPVITGSTPSTVEQGQTTEIGAVTPSTAGDTLILRQTGGSGTVALQLVSGVEEVIYTAPASVPTSTTDAVSYTVTENGVATTGNASVQLDAGPSITAVTPTAVGKGQTTEIGTITPGLAGDTLTLKQTGGSGTIALQLVSGVEEVIYTAPVSVPTSTTDDVTYTVSDQHNDAVATGNASVQLAATGASITAVTPTATLEKSQTTEIATVTPSTAGDTLTLQQTGGSGTVALQLVSGVEEVIYTAPASVPASTIDAVSYTVTENGVTATGNASVQLDAGPSVTAVTPIAIGKGQTTEIGTVTPGLAGDTLTLKQTGGGGTVALQLVSGVEEVIYTAPASVPASTTDAVSYTVSDQYNDVIATGNASIQLKATGASITAVTPTTVEKGQTTEIGTVTPSTAGDALTLKQTGGNGTVALQLVSGVEEVIYTTPASVPSSTTDAVSYTVSENGVAATGNASVQLDAGPSVTAVTPTAVGKGQTTEIGTVTPGIAGDTLTLKQTGGSGTVALELVGGIQEVIYTAPASVPASTIDAVTYTVSDQHNDAVALGAASVQLTAGTQPDAGPSVTLLPFAPGPAKKAVTVATVAPGLPGDTLNLVIAQAPANGTVKLIGTSVQYTPTTAIAKPVSFSFEIKDQTGDTTSMYTVIIGGDLANNVTGGSAGNTDVALGNGINKITLAGNGNVVDASGGVDVISGGVSNNTIVLGNGIDSVTLGGGNNKITAGNGIDVIKFSGGGNTVGLGNGADSVTLAGNGNTVSAGNGADAISGGVSNNTVILGNGLDSVTLSGGNNKVTLGNGLDSVKLAGGGNMVTIGNGAGSVSVGGSGNQITLGNGIDVVHGGTGDTINLAKTTLSLYGTDEMVFIGTGNATVDDFSAGLDLKIGPTAGTDILAHFASDLSGVVDLIGGIGGFKTAAAVVSALKSDGHGGTLLSFGHSSSLDFTGMAPSQLHAANFQIG